MIMNVQSQQKDTLRYGKESKILKKTFTKSVRRLDIIHICNKY